jgi:cell fate regulator YaaT (PSP1 superfamily)
MTDIVSVKFRNRGKAYYFAPNGFAPSKGNHVIVETAKGIEYGICASGVVRIEDTKVKEALKPILRLANERDKILEAQCREQEIAAIPICRKKVLEHGLDMRIIGCDVSFDGLRLLFFFTADGRVDFRELVRDLASIFRKRIELRQIGVRDSARLLGGLGICGREFCCSTYLNEFQPVSVKMAKTQSLSLNPVKISGTCGRLMCCLKNEEDAYAELLKDAPQVDSTVETPLGKALVAEVNLLRRKVKVKISEGSGQVLKTFPFEQVSYTSDNGFVAATAQPEPPALAARPPVRAADDTRQGTRGTFSSGNKSVKHERTREHFNSEQLTVNGEQSPRSQGFASAKGTQRPAAKQYNNPNKSFSKDKDKRRWTNKKKPQKEPGGN